MVPLFASEDRGGKGTIFTLAEARSMFVLVEHYVNDVQRFWSAVRHAVPVQTGLVTLHHCFPTPDGSHAVCVWEAESIRDVRSFVETYIGHASRNLYFPVENAAGTSLPSGVEIPDEEMVGR